jgi:hypothetical protein
MCLTRIEVNVRPALAFLLPLFIRSTTVHEFNIVANNTIIYTYTYTRLRTVPMAFNFDLAKQAVFAITDA